MASSSSPTDTYIGFDSAWTDNAKAPGAICALTVQDGRPTQFYEPRLVSFAEALSFIEAVRSSNGATLVALDQPTIVANLMSMRPVERVAASLISWLGGGVQPSNKGRIGMFCDEAPIWSFLRSLGATEDPEQSRTADGGLHLIEVFPALALASLNPDFFGRLAAPRYNPARRKTFRSEDWARVCNTAADQLEEFGSQQAAEWSRNEATRVVPKKADQDRLDAAICLIIGLHWRFRPRTASMMLGSLTEGYMISPASASARERLTAAANRYGVLVV